jgi:arachidonate 15-lipoxygenase
MLPTLPQNDLKPDRRTSQLWAARADYKYSYKWPPEVAVAEEVPARDGFSRGYLFRAMLLDLRLMLNHDAARIGRLLPFGWRPLAHGARSFSKLLGRSAPRAGKHNVFAVAGGGHGQRSLHKPIETLADYERFFAIIHKNPMVAISHRDQHARDVSFAWQRIAGVNPMIIERVTAPPKRFPVTEEQFRAVLPDDSLEAAGQESRLYLADYAILDGITTGTWDHDRQPKFMYAPLALFAWRRSRGEVPGYLVPVAIQCGQRPGPENPVLTPNDGWRWAMAKLAVQIADGNVHEAGMHLGRTHLVMEAFTLATRRNLAPSHPLYVLLTPHFEFTLSINDHAAHNLIAAGGTVDRLFGGTIEATLGLLRDVLEGFDFRLASPVADTEKRCIGSREELPEYPYRDDALWVWKAVERFADAYVRLYYPSDDAVRADSELQAMIEEVRSPRGGRLSGVPVVEDVGALSQLIGLIIWTASAQHGCLNFAQFPYMGFVPNMPGAGYTPAPDGRTPDTCERYLEMLPTIDRAWEHFDMAYLLSNIRRNHLGHYPFGHFKDRRVRALARRFRDDLKTAGDFIDSQDEGRIISYPYLHPKMIPASIHI